MENKLQKKENNQLITEFEVESKLNILVKGQTNNSKQLQAIRNDLQRGFIGLALRNQELVELNKELTQQLGIVVAELKKYSLQINEHLHWSQKDEYLQLIEDFLNFKVNGKTFESKFCNMVEATEKKCRLLTKNYEMLKNIKPSSISFEFAKWISEIYLCCDEFYPDFDEKDPPDFPFAKNEEDFRNAVADIFPQIQKYCE